MPYFLLSTYRSKIITESTTNKKYYKQKVPQTKTSRIAGYGLNLKDFLITFDSKRKFNSSCYSILRITYAIKM